MLALSTQHSYAFSQSLSLHRWICRRCYPPPSRDNQDGFHFQFLFHTLLSPSPFPMSSSSLIPPLSYLSIRVSSFQPKSIRTDIPSVPPSSLLFFHSVLQWSPEFYRSFTAVTAFQRRQKVVFGDRSEHSVCWKRSLCFVYGKCLSLILSLEFLGTEMDRFTVLSLKTWYSLLKLCFTSASCFP